MILVLLGTQNNSFHRLLEEIDNLIEKGIIKEKVKVQAGYTKYKSDTMEIFDFTSKDKLEEDIEKSDLIITHGGVGSILLSITKNKKVIAIPRQHEYGEHVNNHQKEIVKLFNDKGYIIGIQELNRLGETIEKINKFEPKKYTRNNGKMLKIIEDFIEGV